VRRSRYKVAVDADEGRRRREDNMVEIRKSRREESLLKKRRDGLPAAAAAAAAASPLLAHSSALQQKLEGLPAMVQAVQSDDSAVQLEATTQFRKLLSIGEVSISSLGTARFGWMFVVSLVDVLLYGINIIED
jgi:importin subunit alpha-1